MMLVGTEAARVRCRGPSCRLGHRRMPLSTANSAGLRDRASPHGCRALAHAPAGRRFLVVELEQGLTNQRLAIATYHLLAAATNRTLALDDFRAGNNHYCRRPSTVSACTAKIPFEALFDVNVFARRLPATAPFCLRQGMRAREFGRAQRIERRATTRVVATAESIREYAATHLASEAAVCRQSGNPSDYSDDVYRTHSLSVDPKRLRSERECLQRSTFAKVLEASVHLWVDFVLQTEAPDFWQYDSCFEFARPVVDVADELATSLRGPDQRRIVWLHLRIEDDWRRARPEGCPLHSFNAVVAKLNSTARNSTTERRERCGGVAPARGDTLYVAGGTRLASAQRDALRTVFARVASARATARARAFFAATQAYALAELHPFKAAVDFVVGLRADVVVIAECSTFSLAVVRTRGIGSGRINCNTWAVGTSLQLTPALCRMPFFDARSPVRNRVARGADGAALQCGLRPRLV